MVAVGGRGRWLFSRSARLRSCLWYRAVMCMVVVGLPAFVLVRVSVLSVLPLLGPSSLAG